MVGGYKSRTKPKEKPPQREYHGPPQPLIWINGWHGVGKQTVGTALAMLLGQEKAVFIDGEKFTDHLALPEEHGRPADTAEDVRQRRGACFARYVEDPAEFRRAVIFSDYQPDNLAGGMEALQYEKAARRAGRAFIPIYMECELVENMRRVGTLQRRLSETTKPTSPRAAMALRTGSSGGNGRSFRFAQYEGLTVDVTQQPALESAMQIVAFMRRQMEKKKDEVDDFHSAQTTPMETQ